MARPAAPQPSGDRPEGAPFPRSLLLVQGDDDGKLKAARASGADALIVDLALAIAAPTSFHAAARAHKPRQRVYLRIPAFEAGFAEVDLEAAMAAAPDGVALTGCSDGADVQRLGARLAVLEARHGIADDATRILAFIETAHGLLSLASYRAASPRLAGLAWNAEALAADLGGATARQIDGPYALARTLTLIGAVAAAVAPIDAPFVDVGDEAGLKADAETARRDGFVAKIAVDPAQVAIINAVFTG
ncbi:MAG: CoA ester lyase [Bradyrhizobium sp.]|nr:MAG: CoA ester lyase [Bradyrhizobium sp.]